MSDAPGMARRAGTPRGVDAVLGLVVLGAAWCAIGAAEPLGAGTLGTVAAGVAVTYALTVAARRLRPPSPAPLAFGLLATLASATWLTAGRTTRWGLPTGATVRVLGARARAGVLALSSHPGPWAARPGVVLVLLFAGCVAAAGSASLWALERRRRPGAARPLLALGPPVVLYGALALADHGRIVLWPTALFVGSMAGFVSIEGARPGAGGRSRWPLGRSAVGAVVCAAGAVVVTGAVLVPGSAGAHTAGARTARAAPGPASAAPDVTRLALIDDLARVQIGRARTVVFTARSPVATYWQVATLARFDGTRWTALPGRARGPGAAGRGKVTFTARIVLHHYAGALLPAPPASLRASGRGVGWRDGEVRAGGGSAVRSYRVTAVRTALPGHGAPLATGPLPRATKVRLGADLALPPLPARVLALAHRIVALARGPAARARALQRWFTSGRFHYARDAAPARGDPLTTFLFGSRTGSCEAFAGAFGVLARADGLPTRLAVGFTAGTRVGHDRYEVLGADAHVWPEVYLGPGEGWVGFEPTPASRRPSGSAGSGAARGPSGPAPSVARSGTSLEASGAGAGTRPPLPPGGLPWAWIWALVGAGALLALGACVGRRRRRARGAPAALRAEAPSPADGVLAQWARAERALAGRGLARARAETALEHGDRVRDALCGTGPGRRAAAQYAELATLVSRACYAPGPSDAQDRARARELADATVTSLGR